ncbi:MAG TPA: hypothetical protein VF798_13495 [Burkholderiaceae bacterium]
MLKFVLQWRDMRRARKALSAMLKERHRLRLHSFILFFWTVFAGTLVSHALRQAGMYSLSERYALACGVGYGAFLLGVRVWLWHVEALREEHEREGLSLGDVPDLIEMGVDGAELIGGTVEGLGESAGPIGGEGIAVLPIILIAVGATVAVLVLGPEMLIDVAFEAILAGSLIGAMRLGREPDWFWRALAKTWWVFLLAAILIVAFGKYAQHRYPNATTLAEVLTQASAHRQGK